jgi:hypothetical protein
MATVEELRDEMTRLIAAVAQMATDIGAARPGGPAAAGPPPPVIVLNIEQKINQSSGNWHSYPDRIHNILTKKKVGQRIPPTTELNRPANLT